MTEFDEKTDRQLGTQQIGYWSSQAADQGSPTYPMLWSVWQIAKVLWRIHDRLAAIEGALNKADPSAEDGGA